MLLLLLLLASCHVPSLWNLVGFSKTGVDLDHLRSEEGFSGCRVSSATIENRCDLGRVRIVDGVVMVPTLQY